MEPEDWSRGLDKDQKKKVIDWIQERRTKAFGPIICAVCGHTQWTLGDHLITPSLYQGGGLVLGGSSYPAVMLICNNCGNTLYLNAVMIGLLSGEKEGDSEKEGTNG